MPILTTYQEVTRWLIIEKGTMGGAFEYVNLFES